MDGLVLARAGQGVFGAGGGEAWMRWRAHKLDMRPLDAAELVVHVRNPLSLSRAEKTALVERCLRANMAIYAGPASLDDASVPLRIASQLGLRAGLPASGAELHGDARVPWHTAGHSNPAGLPARASVIHCASAGEGGALALLDPELAWLMLRDQGECLVRALSREDAFSIPHRHDERHAVFAFDAGGDLHMRFSEHRDALRWQCDATVSEAAARLRRLLDRDASCVARTRLAAGMGVVSNNVLMMRAMLLDSRTRMLRATFAERVPGTAAARN